MEFSFGKLFMAAGGALIGAILGGVIAGWRAAAQVAPRPAAGGEIDPLLQANPAAFGASAATVLQGIFYGGIIGLVLVLALLFLLGIERVRTERRFENLDG